MAKDNRGGKPGLMSRRKSALARLEKNYESFKSAGVEKAPWRTTRRLGSRVVIHKGRSFESECARLKEEIDRLKGKIR